MSLNTYTQAIKIETISQTMRELSKEMEKAVCLFSTSLLTYYRSLLMARHAAGMLVLSKYLLRYYRSLLTYRRFVFGISH